MESSCSNSCSALKLPKRPAIANDAQLKKISFPIVLTSNLFPMTVAEKSTVGDYHCFQYDVDFEPEVARDNRPLRYSIFKALQEMIERIIGQFVFSGQSLFTLKKVSDETQKQFEKVIGVEQTNIDGTKYSMRIRFTKDFEINEEEIIGEAQNALAKKGNKVTQVINVILKQAIRNLRFVEIGKNSKFFDINSRVTLNGAYKEDDLEIFKGMQFGTHPTAKKVFLMVDYASRILRKETALEFITPIDSNSINAIIGESVITSYNNHQTYRIERVDTTKNPQSKFLYAKTNTSISFAEYFQQRYGKVIKNLTQPLLVSIRKFREANSNVMKFEEVYLIPELCYMTGLTDSQRQNFKLMKDISEHTKLTPAQRFQQSLRNAQLIQNSTRQSGLQIDTNNSEVKALRLNPPQLTFGQGKSIIPDKGNFDMRQPIADGQFVLKEFVLIYSTDNRKDVDSFYETLTKAAKSYNIIVEEPFYFEQKNFNSKDWIRTLQDDFKKNGLPSFVISFAPDIKQTKQLYSDLKNFLYKDVGIEHQHVTPKSMSKNGMSVASKIALQIASKVGKKLWQTQIPQGLQGKNTMLLGIETSMKRILDGKELRQVVGVVASTSTDFSNYYSEVDIRSDRDTVLPNLSTIVKKALESFVAKNKKLPDNVIVYRQGLGEGQIQQSLQFEITAIQKGFTMYKAGYDPKIAFFQVNKKIGQKFYEKSTNPNKPGLDNPFSGALIGRDIVGKDFFEFFLCAQNCNSGVCTPTKYTCLANTTEFSEDVFWQLTYFQCFNYYNWQGPVRVPATMMYAGKLAKFTSDVLAGRAKANLVNSVYYL